MPEKFSIDKPVDTPFKKDRNADLSRRGFLIGLGAVAATEILPSSAQAKKDKKR